MGSAVNGSTVDVAVVGAGPAGMMLAAELVLGGVDPERVALLDRRPDDVLAGSRAGGFHAGTLELLELRGVADRFVAAGTTHPLPFTGSRLVPYDGLPTRHPYTLGLFQNHIERLLLDWITELGVTVRRSVDVAGVEQDDDGVTLALAGGDDLRARFAVGADGGRSTVRKALGVGFDGVGATRTSIIAEVRVREELPAGVRHDERGTHGVGLMADGVTARMVVGEGEVRRGDAGIDDLRSALIAVFGTDFGVHAPTWISRFSDATRQAERYRVGRVLLVGDAAHTHSPAGGQGIGLGVQDAVNLGWKLAGVVRGWAGDDLLDTYHRERHPADARALQHTLAIGALQRSDPRSVALDALLGDLLDDDAARQRLVARHAGLDVAYDLGGEPADVDRHPLVGRRAPDLDLVVAGEPRRLSSLLHAARPVLLRLGAEPSLDPGRSGDRVDVVAASAEQPWVLPVLGEVAAPTALLLRPDGVVAWVATDAGTDDDAASGLEAALDRWCGPAPAAL